MTFGAVIVVWIGANAVLLATRAFDPYPFHSPQSDSLLLAAVAGAGHHDEPNRAEARDRLRAENDLQSQFEKAEAWKRIRPFAEKIDHLLRRQYNRLFEIQQIQIELLEEISRQKK